MITLINESFQKGLSINKGEVFNASAVSTGQADCDAVHKTIAVKTSQDSRDNDCGKCLKLTTMIMNSERCI